MGHHNSSIVRDAKSFDNAVVSSFLPRLCPPRRICLPPPVPLLDVATTTASLMTMHETFNSQVKSICDGCMEIESVHETPSKSRALAPRRFGALANLSLLNKPRLSTKFISESSVVTSPAFKKWRLKTKSKTSKHSLPWRRLLQKSRDVRLKPERLGASRNRTCHDKIPITSAFHGTMAAKAASPKLKDSTIALRNMSLMVMAMEDPPQMMPARFSHRVHSPPQNIQKAASKTVLLPGVFDVNAVLGVKRLSFLQPTVTPLRAPKLMVTSLLSDAPAVFPLVLRDMFTWSSTAASVAPKICNIRDDLPVPTRLAILNGTFF